MNTVRRADAVDADLQEIISQLKDDIAQRDAMIATLRSSIKSLQAELSATGTTCGWTVR